MVGSIIREGWVVRKPKSSSIVPQVLQFQRKRRRRKDSTLSPRQSNLILQLTAGGKYELKDFQVPRRASELSQQGEMRGVQKQSCQGNREIKRRGNEHVSQAENRKRHTVRVYVFAPSPFIQMFMKLKNVKIVNCIPQCFKITN